MPTGAKGEKRPTDVNARGKWDAGLATKARGFLARGDCREPCNRGYGSC